ncbi:hypothetical protein L4D20_03565 [Vibrio kyushuensis]|uniref:hypothetical protein n=1 Tax=Vibrio kyushuensis TaxID=2910249 RepID=UPI003D14BC51
MGKMWPQLRTPLALAILQSANQFPRSYCGFDLRELALSQNQIRQLVRAGVAEHRRYGVSTQSLTNETIRCEWEKSVDAASAVINAYDRQTAHASTSHQRLTCSGVDTFSHIKRAEFFNIIGTTFSLLKQSKMASQQFRESYANTEGGETRCVIVKTMRETMLSAIGGKQTVFHHLVALGLEKRHLINDNDNKITG